MKKEIIDEETGEIIKPFINPCKGVITSKFGPRVHPITGTVGFHNGVDIGASEGTEIIAPANGEVVYYTPESANKSGGIQLVLLHENGYKTGYAHLRSVVTGKIGTKFKQGERIGEVGNTGASTGSHLHFTLTNPEGIKSDPLGVFDFK